MTEQPDYWAAAVEAYPTQDQGQIISHGEGFTEPRTLADLIDHAVGTGRTGAGAIAAHAARAKRTWTWPAQVVRVVDGDTLEVDADLGLHLTYRGKVRLAGVNCPELGKVAPGVDPLSLPGQQAFAFTSNALWDDWASQPDEGGISGAYYPIVVTSHSLDKYGRILGSVGWVDRTGAAHDLAADLLAAGHAVRA